MSTFEDIDRTADMHGRTARLETGGEYMGIHVRPESLEDSELDEGWKKTWIDLNGVDLQEVAEFIRSLVSHFNERVDWVNEIAADIPPLRRVDKVVRA